jgi:hypothetical protein
MVRYFLLLMKHQLRIMFLVFATGLMGLLLAFAKPNSLKQPHMKNEVLPPTDMSNKSLGAKAKLSESYGKLPLYFEPNPITGTKQAPPEVRFISRGSGYTLFITPIEAVFSLGQSRVSSKKRNEKEAVLRLRLLGSNQKASCEGMESLSGVSNYLIGNDPAQWRTNIPLYGKVKFKDVYPGVDMVYYGNQQKLEYDFVVQPGVDPNVIQLKYEGARNAKVVDGNLVLKVGKGEVAFKAPLVYQVKDGERHMIQGRYAMAGKHRVGFEVSTYDLNQPLVIDPVLDYSTFLEGNNADQANAIVVDSSNNAYIAGYTTSSNFPTFGSPYQGSLASGGVTNAFVTKLNSSGSGLVFST